MSRTAMPPLLGAVALVTLASAPAPASAATRMDEAAGAEAPAADPTDPHDHPAQDIIVTGALPRSRQDLLSGVAVIQGVQLDRSLRASIGDTLDRTPGVSATSFGPTASRPVLRGLQGERVRLLSDGIGSIDVSNTSADHAAVVNPLLAERIEVLRGPQSLLYGASAIGGVVNVIDRRIPVSAPAEPVHLGAVGTWGSAANERSLAGTIEAALGGGFVAHADGSYDRADDLRIGGHALTPALRAAALDLASRVLLVPGSIPDYAANAAVAGTLPNTAARTWTAGAGLSYVNADGMLGVSYTRTDSLYGVPIRFATDLGQGQESPRLQLRQDRFDLRAEIRASGPLIEKVLLRAGFADYRHAELDPDGTVGTTFLNQGIEARLELTQAAHGAWRGASGAQLVSRDFDVIGAEAFLPQNGTRQFGLFTLQTLDYGAWKLEAGARFERARIEARPAAGQPQFAAAVRRFDTLSLSGGASYQFAPGWRLGVNLSRTERAPAAEELFANGPHAGTEAFEVGDPDLALERANSVEAVLRGQGEGYSFELSAYHTRFDHFIFMARTGAVEDGLPVYRIGQAGARWSGFEAQGEVTLARRGAWTIKADALADLVRATIDGFGPAPQIPPLRWLGGLGAASAHWDLRAEVERVTRQDRTAANETATPGYTMVNASLGWRPWGADRPVTLLLSANNLLDVVARRHASFLKDYAPLAGRDIRVTVRLEL